MPGLAKSEGDLRRRNLRQKLALEKYWNGGLFEKYVAQNTRALYFEYMCAFKWTRKNQLFALTFSLRGATNINFKGHQKAKSSSNNRRLRMNLGHVLKIRSKWILELYIYLSLSTLLLLWKSRSCCFIRPRKSLGKCASLADDAHNSNWYSTWKKDWELKNNTES